MPRSFSRSSTSSTKIARGPFELLKSKGATKSSPRFHSTLVGSRASTVPTANSLASETAGHERTFILGLDCLEQGERHGVRAPFLDFCGADVLHLV